MGGRRRQPATVWRQPPWREFVSRHVEQLCPRETVSVRRYWLTLLVLSLVFLLFIAFIYNQDLSPEYQLYYSLLESSQEVGEEEK